MGLSWFSGMNVARPGSFLRFISCNSLDATSSDSTTMWNSLGGGGSGRTIEGRGEGRGAIGMG